MSYICTGGGALIRFLTGEELPVVEGRSDTQQRSLNNAAAAFTKNRKDSCRRQFPKLPERAWVTHI